MQQGPNHGVPRTDPLAIASLVVGLVGMVLACCCGAFGIPVHLAAIAMGGFSLYRMGEDPSLTGKGLAIGGIVAGGIGFLLAVILLIVGFSLQSSEFMRPR